MDHDVLGHFTSSRKLLKSRYERAYIQQVGILRRYCHHALPVGIACFFFGFILLDNPCAFCWQERTAMILVALTALYIVRFGLKPKYIAALVWLGIYGAFMASVHTSINLGSDIGQGFSLKIMAPIPTPGHCWSSSWSLWLLLC